MAGRPRGLDAADPRVGQTLSYQGREWEVTDHSSYWDDEGYRVVEWCLETDDTEAYLLKEIHEGAPTRWFFTRQIPRVEVTPGIDPRGEPPPTLTQAGRAFRYAESTEGTYEDEPGQRVQKTTWEYWDDAHQQNLAVEVWADGRVDCYRGSYIEPDQVTAAEAAGGAAGVRESRGAGPMDTGAALAAVGAAMRARQARKDAGPGNPFLAAAWAFPFGYVVLFFLGRPFDEALVGALPFAVFCGWISASRRAPGGFLVGVLGVLVVGYLFWQFAPLTSPLGLAAVLGAPAAVAMWGRRHRERGRRSVIYLAALVVAFPALLLGFYHYHRFAPGPHSFDQLLLALGPAAVAGVGALVVAGLLLVGTESRAS
jgi:hypothetical protein